MVTKSAVIGIDLGSSDSYVGYVGKGIVDICQNEVSRRNTPTLVGFTDRERLLGDAALAQIKSNAKNTCRNFKHLLGQDINSPYVEAERFWSTSSIVEASDGHPGYDVVYKGERQVITAVQACAMFLTKLKEVTEKWTQGKLSDCVIAVPAYFSDIHRQAVLDAAKVAGISVLRLLNEHTATALAYGIYRSNDFDPEKPVNVVFCSMGHTIFSVSVVQYVKGKLTVVCERSDKVGGRDMDECLMREFAAQFQKKVGCDPLSNKKAAFKLEDAVTKTKKILSANFEASLSCECLMEDEDFGSNINRDTFLEMCKPMMAKVSAVLEAAKAASGIPVEDIEAIEVVGGATRVPWVKEMCSAAFGGKALSTTMNADESVARGAALQAAILSPLYKVRDFKVEDVHPYAVSVGWTGSATDAMAARAEGEEGGDAEMVAAEGEYKTATLFPRGSAMNLLKQLTFFRSGPFSLKAHYEDESCLIPGTPRDLGSFSVELPRQADAKKVKVKAKLTIHGTFALENAQLVEEEEVEETVKEKREVVPTPEEAAAAEAVAAGDGAAATASASASAGAPAEGAEAPAAAGGERPEAAAEKKEPEKKYEWVDVVKKRKRTKCTDVDIARSGCPGLGPPEIQRLMDLETAMQAEMQELIETDEKRNDLEAYIFNMRDKVAESGEYGAFIAPADRDAFIPSLTAAEDWLYDAEDATKLMYIDRLEELKIMGDPVAWRFKESQMRDEWITAISGTISNYRVAAETPGDNYGHISPDKLGKIVGECDSAAQWLSELQKQQALLKRSDKPVLVCAEIEKKGQELAKFADEILKEPKPKTPEPAKEEEEKKEEEAPKEAPNEAEAAPAEPPKEGGDMDVD